MNALLYVTKKKLMVMAGMKKRLDLTVSEIYLNFCWKNKKF